MANPKDILRPGSELTGRKLIEALEHGKVRDGGHVAVTHLDGQVTPTNVKPDPRRFYKFFARLTSFTPVGLNQWTYGFQHQYRNTDPFVVPPWQTWTPGYTEVTIGSEAFNICEEMNDGVGIEGNGIDVDTLNEGFSLQPAPIGLMVEMTLVRVQTTDQMEPWFSFPNQIDGMCMGAATESARIDWNTQKLLEVERSLGYVAGKG
ncbi:MAG: hypothetical protein KJO36_06130 [Acidimicrobiia bacterium]|nr:hypothetical protein [Acidimicrobiia bacterium]